MSPPRTSSLVIDRGGTARIRARASSRAVKITINIDAGSLGLLKKMATETGAPYQRILNQVLKEGLEGQTSAESRLSRLEKEVERLKRRVA